MFQERWLISISLLLTLSILADTRLRADVWPRYETLVAEVERLDENNQRLAEQAASLRREVDSIGHRREVQEQVVRETLGYVRPGDEVYEVH
ncbi:MAG: septum formation initiator family protein [Cytophagaceae bacterium]|nr:MAG: septum formation initiator family protein [Cytophagaceae bacterium]